MFAVAICITYFLIKEYKRVKGDNRLLLFFYFLLGLLFFIYEFFIAYYETDLTFFLSIIAIYSFFFAIYSDRKSVFFIIPLATVGTFFNFYNQDVEFLNSFTFAIFNFLIIIFISWLVTYSGIEYFKNNNNSKNVILASLIYLIFFFSFLAVYEKIFLTLIAKDIILLFIYEILIFSFFVFIVFYLFKGVDLLYLNYFNLSKNLFDKKQSYYKMALWRKKLNEKIFTEKITFGALIFLKINYKNLEKETLEKFLEDFNNELNKKYENVFYFKSSNLYYSFFIPMKESDINLEIFYQNNSSKIRKKDFFSSLKNILTNNLYKNISKKIYISLYGVDSSNINDLIKNNEYLIFEDIEFDKKYPIQIFNYRIFKNSLLERFELYTYMSKYEKLDLNYYLYLSEKKIYLYNAILTENNNKIYLNSLESKKSKKEYTYLLRYAALNALKNFKKDDFDYFILDYPINYLINNDIDITIFAKKISNMFNYSLEKLLIGFRIEDFKKTWEIKKLSEILIKLEECKIKYAILDEKEYKNIHSKYLNPILKIEGNKYKIANKIFDLSFI
ncbi:MAG: hypothetical protein HPAVJP_0290 [Candidatus Hepatoplasma vulgare]|nr:MAG: hypothetical protein HPAVJP_0290 [Candidatus Hepatoplasma sp.]